MNVIDIAAILIILCAGVIGLKRGFFKQLVLTVGLFLVYYVSFKLKNPLAEFLSYNFPFFNFGGVFEGAVALNIIMYQAIAFIIIFSLIMIIFKVVNAFTGFVEKVLDWTIILAIPSKIGGFIIGLIEGYIIVFIVMFILSQPFLRIDVVQNSKYREPILNSSPVLSSVVRNTNKALKDIYVLEKEFIKTKDVNYFNDKTIEILLNYNIVDDNYIDKLYSLGKLY